MIVGKVVKFTRYERISKKGCLSFITASFNTGMDKRFSWMAALMMQELAEGQCLKSCNNIGL